MAMPVSLVAMLIPLLSQQQSVPSDHRLIKAGINLLRVFKCLGPRLLHQALALRLSEDNVRPVRTHTSASTTFASKSGPHRSELTR